MDIRHIVTNIMIENQILEILVLPKKALLFQILNIENLNK